ncbi:MAG TPA: addiction module protein [Xanthomonadaceae bacterium]|nr:addiction module protein [Xanthomonadaceae bacterium]
METMMGKSAQSIFDAAKELPPAERLEVVDRILASLDEPDQALDALWAKEAEDRLAAFRTGEIRAIPLDEVLAKYPRQ